MKTWSDFGLKTLKDHANPSQPSYSHLKKHIPGLPGVLYFGSEVQGREGIQVSFKKLTKEEWEINHTVNEINRFLFDEFKQPRLLKTVFDYEPNKYVWLQVENSFTIDRHSILNGFTITFVQFDDNKYSIEEANDVVWGSETIDFLADYTLGNSGSDAKERQITGNTTLNPFLEGLALRPFFEINGIGTNVRITCAGQSIEVGSFTNANVQIDVENFIAYFNGAERQITFGDFYLIPNQTVQITGTNMNFKLTLHYRDIYL